MLKEDQQAKEGEQNLGNSQLSVSGQQLTEEQKQAKLIPTIKNLKCEKAYIQGKVTFGKGCIIHPNAQIISEVGEIIIKDFNIIEEKVRIYNRILKDKDGQIRNRVMTIGSYNYFEVGAIIETTDIGDCNTFQNRCYVEINCRIQDGCNIGVGVRIPSMTKIESQNSICYPGQMNLNLTFNKEAHKAKIFKLYETLVQVLPKYNKISHI